MKLNADTVHTKKHYLFFRFSSAHCGLFIYQWQDREKPGNIPNPQGKFVICSVYIPVSVCAMTFVLQEQSIILSMV